MRRGGGAMTASGMARTDYTAASRLRAQPGHCGAALRAIGPGRIMPSSPTRADAC